MLYEKSLLEWRFPSEMTYIVPGGALNSTALNIRHLLTHSLTQSITFQRFSDQLQSKQHAAEFNSRKRKSVYFRFRCRLWKYQPVSALWLNIVGLQMAMDECSAIEDIHTDSNGQVCSMRRLNLHLETQVNALTDMIALRVYTSSGLLLFC